MKSYPSLRLLKNVSRRGIRNRSLIEVSDPIVERPLLMQQLEARILYSATAAAPAPEAAPEEAPAQESVESSADSPPEAQSVVSPDSTATESSEAEAPAEEQIGSSSYNAPSQASSSSTGNIDIIFDYSLDTSNFFTNNPEAVTRLEEAASIYESRFTDTLAAIDPTGPNTWTVQFTHPSTGNLHEIVDLTVPSNSLIIYVGSRNLAGSTLAEAGPGGYESYGTQVFLDTVSMRGEEGATQGVGAREFAPWGGDIVFDPNVDWNFSTDLPDFDESDFFSVAVHELGHVFGIGSADAWFDQIVDGKFTGANSTATYGADVLLGDGAHWAEGIISQAHDTGIDQEVVLDPSITDGQRLTLTTLDLNGFDDIGWDVIYGSLEDQSPVIQPIADQTFSRGVDQIEIPLGFSDPDTDSGLLTVMGTAPGAPVSISIDGGTLTVDPADDYFGTFEVIVSVSDGVSTVEESFNVTVTNEAPIIQPIPDQTMGRNQDTLILPLAVTDPDGDDVTFEISILPGSSSTGPAFDTNLVTYSLDGSTLTLDPPAGVAGEFRVMVFASDGARISSEEFLVTIMNHAPVLAPISDQMMGRNDDTLVVPLNISDADGDSIEWTTHFYADEGVEVGLTVTDGQLTIDPPAGFIGDFVVHLFASDGSEFAEQLFNVVVSNSAPVIEPISDLQMVHSDAPVDINLSISDVDNDALVVTAAAWTKYPIAELAQSLDVENKFVKEVSSRQDRLGNNEKWLKGSGGWYTIHPNGDVFQGSTNDSSILLGTLDSSYYADTSKLTDPPALADQTLIPSFQTTVVDGVLTVEPPSGFVGYSEIILTVTDGDLQTSESFVIEVTNEHPVFGEIADQTMTRNQDTLVVALDISDADGDELVWTGSAFTADPITETAFTLDQEHEFRQENSNKFNRLGHNEKWFKGNNGWYTIRPDGSLYQGNNEASSVLLGTLDSTYYETVTSLFDAPAPAEATLIADIAVTVVDGVLTVDPPAGYAGTFEVSLAVSDGVSVENQTFHVEVFNSEPVLGEIENQTMTRNQDTLEIPLAIFDADGDAIIWQLAAATANPVATLAHNLDQTHNFRNETTNRFNRFGFDEKWVKGDNGWYTVRPDGSIYEGSKVETSILLGTLDSTYYDTLENLFDAPEPPAPIALPDIGLAVDSGVLTVDPPAGYAGVFEVTVTAFDGGLSATSAFIVEIENEDPTLGPISEQSMTRNQDTLIVPLDIADADGDTIAWTLSAVLVDPITELSYELDQTYDFRDEITNRFNRFGYDEKWFKGTGGWFTIRPNGDVYQGHKDDTSILIGSLDSSFYTTPANLIDVPAPPEREAFPEVLLSVDANNNLIVDPPEGFLGTIEVAVVAYDGGVAVEQRFIVNVTNSAPVLEEIPDQSLSSGLNSLLVPLVIDDVDGDTITWTATAETADPTAELAFELDQEHGFKSENASRFDRFGYGEKWFKGNNGWYTIRPNGGIYEGSKDETSILIGSLDSSFYDDPTTLFDVTAPPAAIELPQILFSVGPDELTIDLPAEYSGTFRVNLAASDGLLEAARSFVVVVS